MEGKYIDLRTGKAYSVSDIIQKDSPIKIYNYIKAKNRIQKILPTIEDTTEVVVDMPGQEDNIIFLPGGTGYIRIIDEAGMIRVYSPEILGGINEDEMHGYLVDKGLSEENARKATEVISKIIEYSNLEPKEIIKEALGHLNIEQQT